jgi:hypothetical protein
MMSKSIKYLIASIPVILILLAIALPNFVGSRTVMAANACANNLRQIEAAKKQWALENRKTMNDVPTEKDLLPIISRGHEMSGFLSCPGKGVYSIGSIGQPAKCSIGGVGHSLSVN